MEINIKLLRDYSCSIKLCGIMALLRGLFGDNYKGLTNYIMSTVEHYAIIALFAVSLETNIRVLQDYSCSIVPCGIIALFGVFLKTNAKFLRDYSCSIKPYASIALFGVFWRLVLGGCGILNSVPVLVFSHPKTQVSVSGLILALKYGKVRPIHILSPKIHNLWSTHQSGGE